MKMKMIKRLFKRFIKLLPFSVGRRVVAPCVKWFISVFIYFSPIRDHQKRKMIRQQACRIDKLIWAGCRQATIVYDNFVSPPTYGDFLYVVLMARYLIANEVKVNFIIVDSEYREDWSSLTKVEIERFVIEQSKLAYALLDPMFVSVERTGWQALWDRISSKSIGFDPFMECTVARKPIYMNCFNVLNHLLHGKSRSQVNSTLFSKDLLSTKADFVSFNSNYITWACRYSNKWGQDRNLTESEFISTYNLLRNKYPLHMIMVVTDQAGYNYYSAIASKNNLDLTNSKDYSTSFLGDAALILNSEYFYQLKGGGIAIIPMFSALPYEISSVVSGELMWSRSKLLSFQLDSQLFINRSLPLFVG